MRKLIICVCLAMVFLSIVGSSCMAANVSGEIWRNASALPSAVESAHPYAPGLNETYTFTAPVGLKTRLHFEKMDTEAGYDWVYVKDSADNIIAKYAGRNLADFWTPWVPGNVVKLTFVSDGSAQGFGWVVDKYVTDTIAAPIVGATVTLSPGGLSATTASDGSYTILDVPAGNYTATPSLAGKAFSSPSVGLSVTASVGASADFEAFDNNVASAVVSPNPFAPTGFDTTLITVAAAAGQAGMFARIVGGNIDKRVELHEIVPGSYTSTWDGLDHSTAEPQIPASGAYAVRIYNASVDLFPLQGTVTLNSISTVSASPQLFYPTTGQSTAVTVAGAAGLPLTMSVVNSGGTVVRELSLVWVTSAYTAVWDGKDELGVYQPAGTYDLRVFRGDTGTHYVAAGTVAIGLAAGITGQVWNGVALITPKLESKHPYDPSINETYTFTSPSGSKTRLHFESMDTEAGYDWVSVQDSAGNTYAKYAGRNLTDFWTPWVPGNVVKLKFTSDGSVQGAGWIVDKYTTDDIQTPLAGVKVTLTPGGRNTTTSADGVYTIADLSPGTYTVVPSLAGLAFSSRSIDVTVSSIQGGTADFEGYEDVVTGVSASPNPFIPTGSNSTTITASAAPGIIGLLARVVGAGADAAIGLTESAAGVYTGQWAGLDSSGTEPKILANGDFKVSFYNQDNDLLTKSLTINLKSTTLVTAAPTVFYPTTGQTTVIKVTGGVNSLLLQARIVKGDGTLVRTLPLVWQTDAYYATWDGKNDSAVFQPAGTYDLRIHRSDTGVMYATSGNVAIGQSAGINGKIWSEARALDPKIESDHDYAPNLNKTYTFTATATSVTKTRLHFEYMDTEANYDWVDVQDASGNSVAKYAGRGLTDFWTPWVPGNVVKLKFTSDSSAQGFGWIVDKYVTDDIQLPIIGATVTLAPGGRTATTGADGTYTITDLGPGTYTVTPSMAGWAFSSKTSSVTVSSTQGGIADFEGFENILSSLTVLPNPFAPSSANTALITAAATPGEAGLFVRVSSGTIDRKISLLETITPGIYTAQWDGMDVTSYPDPRIPVSGNWTVKAYNAQNDLYPTTATLALQSVNAVTVSLSTFYPTSGQGLLIKATAAISTLPLETRIYDASNNLVRTLPLVWAADAFYVTWDGKNVDGVFQAAGNYEVRVYRTDTGARYAASAAVAIGVSAVLNGQLWTGATAMTPTIESDHPYNPNLNKTYTFTAPSGTKTRVHIESMDTEAGYDFLYIEDAAGNMIAKYAGRGLNDFWTPWVPGNVVKLRFTSDGSAQGAGWVVDRYATDDTIVGIDAATITTASPTRTGLTGVDGNYTMAGFAPGTYTITPSKSGMRFSSASVSAALVANQTTTIDFEGWADWVTATSVSPSPFAPSGANTANISVSGIAGATGLYARIIGSASDHKINLTEGTAGVYGCAWDGMDHSFAEPRILLSGSYLVRAYSSSADPFTSSANVTLNSVSAVSASPASFYGTAGQTTTVTVAGASGLPLQLRVANSLGVVVRTIPLVWGGSSYQAIWDAKSDGAVVQVAGTYELRVYRADTGARYVASGTSIILPAAGVKGQVWVGGQVLLPVVESSHPYANGANQTWTITAAAGTKTRVHFEKIDVESPNDHVYVKDINGTTIADYRGVYNDIWSPWVTGKTVKIVMTSNASITSYGFVADRYVTDASAVGLEGIQITINPGNRKTVTGVAGSYSVMDLVPGSYTVTPSGTGWTFDPVSTGVSLSSASAPQVDFWAITQGEVLTSIAQARQRPDGWSVQLPFKTVSATFAGSFYIEDENGVAGIRVESATPVLEGKSARVVGRLTTVNGERTILPYSMDVVDGTIEIKPVGLNGKSVVGSNMNIYTPGISGATGLNNSGLLVRVWGKVTQVDANVFYIDDGSGLNGGLGIAVSKTGLYTGRALPTVVKDDVVAVTGIAATQKTGSTLERLIRPRNMGDIKKNP